MPLKREGISFAFFFQLLLNCEITSSKKVVIFHAKTLWNDNQKVTSLKKINDVIKKMILTETEALILSPD